MAAYGITMSWCLKLFQSAIDSDTLYVFVLCSLLSKFGPTIRFRVFMVRVIVVKEKP